MIATLRKAGFRLPSKLEWLFSIKTFIASMVALYIALKLELPRPYWAMASVYVVSNPFVGATRSKAVYRAIGTAIGAAAAAVLLPPFVEQPLVFSAIVAVWSGLLLFASMHDRSARGYVFVLAGYTMPLVALSAVDSPYTLFDVAVSRTEEITVGIICASVVGSILFPMKLSSSLAERAAEWFSEASKFGSLCLASENRTGITTSRRRLVTLSNSLEFVVSQLSYDHASPSAIKLAQQLIARMQLLVVIGSAIVDALLDQEREGDAKPEELQTAIQLVENRFKESRIRREPLQTLHGSLKALRQSCMMRNALQSARFESIFRRLGQLADVWDDCLTLEAALYRPPSSWRGAFRHWRVTTPRPYRDTPMLVLSALSVVLGIFIACCLWIYSGWTDGALGVTLAAVSCCFFATLDDPASQIAQYFVAVSSSIVIAGFYVIAVVPHVQDFAMLVIVFFVPFVLLGAVIPRTRYAVGTMLTAVNTATFLSIQGIYDINFDSFLNLNIAGSVGLLFALIWMRLMKPFGSDMVVARYTRKSWADIITASSPQRIQNQRLFSAHVLDRLMQTLQRQTSKEANGVHPSFESLRETRIIFSVLDLRRLQKRVSVDVRTTIETVLRNIESYFRVCGRRRRRGRVPATLLQSINDATTLVYSLRATLPSAEQSKTTTMSEVVLKLSDLRSSLIHGQPGERN